VLVDNGDTIEKNLHRTRISEEELAQEARMSQIASLNDVEWAILETSGKVSFIPKKG
jgi:uncharacterized membrane protein YcaP (DUF421 family)